MYNKSSLTAILMTIVSGMLMATSAVVFKWIAIPAEIFIFFRMFIGAIFFALYLFITRQSLRYKNGFPLSSCIAGACLAAVFILYMKSLSYLGMTVAIMFVYMGPLLATIAAHFIFQERLNQKTSALIITAFLGFLMIQDFSSGKSLHLDTGITLGLGAAISYALFVIINRYPVPADEQNIRLFYQLLSGAIVCIPFTPDFTLNFSNEQWFGIIFTGIFPGCLAIFFAVSAIQRLETSVVNTLLYIEPVFV
ncbi:MAG: DMT family transporter, partial [Oceanospirillaceae bacterium]|nr:DMT family transporter [Oceanospirillaceae bacterium]